MLKIAKLDQRTGQPSPFVHDMDRQDAVLSKGIGIALGHDFEAEPQRLGRPRIGAPGRRSYLHQSLGAPGIYFASACAEGSGAQALLDDRGQTLFADIIVETAEGNVRRGEAGLHRENMQTRTAEVDEQIDRTAEGSEAVTQIHLAGRREVGKHGDIARVSRPALPILAVPGQDGERKRPVRSSAKAGRLNPDVMRERVRCQWQKHGGREQFADHSSNILSERGLVLTAAVLGLFGSAPALAHTNTGLAGGLVSGFEHPFLGADHLLAMVAVGIWGAFLGRPLIYVLPIIFPMMMAVGAVLGILAVPMLPTEIGIAISMVVLGAVIAFAIRASVAVAVGLISIFALFHGYAHGTELPFASNPQPYVVGFVLATGLLHLAGIAIGLARDRPGGTTGLRMAGGAISLVGLAFLSRIMTT